MGSAYIFDRNGNQLEALAGAVAAGRCAYMGGNFLLVSNPNTVEFRQYSIRRGNGLIRRVDTHRISTGLIVEWQGVAFDHSRFQSGNHDFFDFDGQSFYSWGAQGDFEPQDWFLYQHQIQDAEGAMLRDELFSVGTEGDLATATALEHDGHYLWILWDDGTAIPPD